MFPARAGMNRWNVSNEGRCNHVPRTRGDEPYDQQKRDALEICSPHARG